MNINFNLPPEINSVSSNQVNRSKSNENSTHADTIQDKFEHSTETHSEVDFKSLLQLINNGKQFSFPADKSSLERMSKLAGEAPTQAELQQAKKDLKLLLNARAEASGLDTKSFKNSGEPEAQWFNMSESSINNSLNEMKKVSGEINWEKITQGRAKKDTPSIYETYYKNSQIPTAEMGQVLDVGKDLRSARSKYFTTGNNVQPLPANEIWDTKMKMLDDAIAHPKNGNKSVEIDAEYYELSSDMMIDRLGKAADAGAKVRVVVDPGMLSSVSKDTFDATSIAVKASSVEKLLRNHDGKDIAVTYFPNKEMLGSRAEIMHRKLFRVGDSVVFGGMNANKASSENVDFAAKIEGPAAKKMGEMFKSDAQLSAGKSMEQIYGSQQEMLKDPSKKIQMGRWGVDSMLSAAFAPTAGLSGKESKEEEIDKLFAAADKAGVDLSKLAVSSDANEAAIDKEQLKAYLLKDSTKNVNLTTEGRELLSKVMDETHAKISSKENVKKYSNITPPEGKRASGTSSKDKVAFGDTPAEREAMLLETINSADRYIKVSSFVMNKGVADLLIQKKKDMDAAGKPFEVQVIMDPGLYGYGGTPNEEGFKELEDAGIDVKWNLLERTGEHDRKNHSKMIVTDNAIFTGSTNFSSKGLRDNWEANAIMKLDPNDPESVAKQKAIEANFDRNFSRNGIGFDSKKAAAEVYKDYDGIDKDLLIQDERNRQIRTFCRKIENYEVQSAAYLKNKFPQLNGNSEINGYSVLSTLTDKDIDEMRSQLPAWKALH